MLVQSARRVLRDSKINWSFLILISVAIAADAIIALVIYHFT